MNETPRPTSVRTKGEGLVGRTVNVVAVFGSLALMIVAVSRAPSVDGGAGAYGLDLRQLSADLFRGRPAALSMAACLAITLTPLVRMLVLAVYLWWQRRRGFSAAAFAVVGILTAAYLVS